MDAYDRVAELGGALQTSLADIRFPLTAPIEREIQRQVCEYVDELKGLGLPPERVLMAVKYNANQAGIYATQRLVTPQDQLHGKDKLLVDMVGWCIKQYYGQTSRAD